MKFNTGESFFDAQPMFVCDQATLQILDVNQAAIDILGYSRKELLKKRVIDYGVQKPISSLDLGSGSNDFKGIDKVWEFSSNSGDQIYFQLSAHMINYKGKPAKMVIAHNISKAIKSKKGDKKLLSSQVNIANFPFAEIEWDVSLNVLRWSEKAEQLFGYSEEEAMNNKKLLKEFVHEDDLDYVREKLDETYKKGAQEISIINRNIKKNGDVIYCEWYNSLLYNSDGEVVSVYSLTHDVTARERAVEEAKRSMMSYQDLFNSIGDAIYLLNKEGVIIEANEGLLKTFGYTPSEVVGKHSEMLAAPGKHDVERLEEIIKKSMEGEAGKYEGWGRKKSGEIFPTEFMINTGTYFGEDILIVIERDITDRKESEEALKNREGLFSKLFNSSPLGIALLNEHHEVEMVNEGFEHLFGYSEKELKGLELDKVIVPDKKQEEAKELSDSNQVTEATVRRIRKDGKELDVIIYAVPVIVEKNVVGIYGIYVDITDRKQAEEKVKKSLHEKEILLAEVHHRVKNNLAVITGLLELQSYSAENESAREILKDSQMRVNSIAMVHEKLYQSEDFSEVDIEHYFNELIEVIQNTMERTDLEVNTVLDIMHVKLPIIQAIPLGLLLNEIITNCYKHAFKGRNEGRIDISLSRNKDNLKLVIQDNGIGMPDHSDDDINSSLGLKLIKTLTKQLDATFEVYSKGGTTYEFEFEKKEEVTLE